MFPPKVVDIIANNRVQTMEDKPDQLLCYRYVTDSISSHYAHL